MNPKPSAWYRTGEARIAPWYFGIMRAEVLERRDYRWEGDDEVTSYQMRWVGIGRLPAEHDGPSSSGFWSTLASGKLRGRPQYGWLQLITYWPDLFGKKEPSRAMARQTEERRDG